MPGQPVALVAGDDALIRHVVRIALERIGMFVLTATDGERALELSRTFPGAIHALVSDVIMPNLNGLGLCEQIQRERPAIKVLLMSAARGPVNGLPFLRKPFIVAELQQQVQKLLTRGRRQRRDPVPPSTRYRA